MSLDLLDRASHQFLASARSVPADGWSRPSTCDGWSVRDLVAHVVTGCNVSIALLAGASKDEAMEVRGRAIEGDVVAALETALTTMATSFAEPGALERTVTHPVIGPMGGKNVLDQRISELTVHGWDLERSLGRDGALDPTLATATWTSIEPLVPILSQLGTFGAGASGTLGDDVPVADRLLDATGRRP